MTRGDQLRIDTAQPLNYGNSVADTLLRGMQGFWIAPAPWANGSRLYDLSSYGRHCDLVESYSWTQIPEYPISGIQYSGGVARVESLSGLLPASFGVVCRPTAVDDMAAICYTDPNSNFDFIEVGFTSGGSLAFRANGGAGGSVTFTGGSYNANELLTLSFDFDGDVNVYKNGNTVITDNYGSASAGLTRVGIGRLDRPSPTKVFSGDILAAWVQPSMSAADHDLMHSQAERGFPDLLNRRGI